jgi:hypothetical protein
MDQARVAALSLNLRSSPMGSVLGVLHENEIVAVSGPADGAWLPVTAKIGGKMIAGFAASAYLAREMSAPAAVLASTAIPIADDAAHPVTLDGNVAVGPDKSRFASAYALGFYAHGITALGTYTAALGTTLAPSASVLRVLVAAAQNEGLLESVNSYDDAFLSAGFQQWTLGTGGDPGELPVLLARLQATDGAGFADCFGRYALGVKTSGRTGFLTISGVDVNSAAAKAQFRAKEWAYRFWRAGHHPSLRAAQVSLAAERITIVRALPLRAYTAGDWLTSEHGIALLLDEHINRPSHLPATLDVAVNQVVAAGCPDDPARWDQAQELQLIRAYADARTHTTMTDPMGRANRIAASVTAGKLSDARGSFSP